MCLTGFLFTYLFLFFKFISTFTSFIFVEKEIKYICIFKKVIELVYNKTLKIKITFLKYVYKLYVYKVFQISYFIAVTVCHYITGTMLLILHKYFFKNFYMISTGKLFSFHETFMFEGNNGDMLKY